MSISLSSDALLQSSHRRCLCSILPHVATFDVMLPSCHCKTADPTLVWSFFQDLPQEFGGKAQMVPIQRTTDSFLESNGSARQAAAVSA